MSENENVCVTCGVDLTGEDEEEHECDEEEE